MSNAQDLANWISRVHRPISLILHEQRAVPLENYYFLDGKRHLVQDADGNRMERFPNIGGEAKLAQMTARSRSFPFDDDDEEDDESDVDIWEQRHRKDKYSQQQPSKAKPDTVNEDTPTVILTATHTPTSSDT